MFACGHVKARVSFGWRGSYADLVPYAAIFCMGIGISRIPCYRMHVAIIVVHSLVLYLNLLRR